ncbi:winged helix-turn-helix transcriptional regulator [Catenulispora sp. NF23]|uniref:Winged helix-turn-helix transcriptional regulator n=1 Tax=Catenulispora pinistramenti TaxID=2705254 RepID=A0ABS5L0Y3_9ACTN|nr:winged helix-turn-helix domain-containing protein [Catenulispora pinistramenti]MBS2536480.1 winged helix-turn-helix transcriptional regulator [Catenulispora pinistramenti]MBS2551963.1 winged helix-turn-helix transcriptional regulator [Catenulispora pinistramenti]
MADDSPRKISDTRVLAALTHPLRRQILDVLEADGPATVGMLAERTGEAVGNVSHHVRVLADARLVEDVPELARDRRERWWRATSAEVLWARADFEGSPADAAVADAAGSLMLERQLAAARSWPARRAGYSPQWREVGSLSTEAWLRLSPEEAREFGAQLMALLDTWSHRAVPDDSQDRDSVLVFAHVVPTAP